MGIVSQSSPHALRSTEGSDLTEPALREPSPASSKDTAQNAPLLSLRRSGRSLIVPLFGLVGLGIALVSAPALALSAPPVAWPALRWSALLPLLLAAELFRRYWNSHYEFRPDTVTGVYGHLSLSFRVPRVRYCDVVEIQVWQGPLGRLLGYGTLCMRVPGRSRPVIKLCGIRDPEQIAALVDELRDALCAKTYPDKPACRYRVHGKIVDRLAR